eukprot:Skav233108  [mRNA]  locus=scaffold1342:222927:226283:- [translate_table: standard]
MSVQKQLEEILSDLHRQLCADHHLVIQSLQKDLQSEADKSEGVASSPAGKPAKRLRSGKSSSFQWLNLQSSDSLCRLQRRSP